MSGFDEKTGSDSSAPQGTRGGFVSPAWLHERLGREDVVVLDGSYYLPTMNRNADAEFLAAHVPGAVRFDIDAISDPSSGLPHMLPSPEAFADAVGALGVGDGKTVVVYDGAGLFSAPRVAWTLRTFGADDVRILEGGFPAWTAAGLPVESGPAASRKPARFTPRFDPGAVADRARVAHALASGDAQVVDARPRERFLGQAPEPRPGLPSGHMPGALNVPYSKLVEDGRLRPREELEAAFRDAGVDLNRPVVTSCGSGVSAAIVSLALSEVGKPASALYDGSWADWASQPDAAIEDRGPR